MQIRPLVPWGLALFVSAGCQSYYPNGYGHHGPYSNFPTGPYVPPVTTTPGSSGTGLKSPTPVGGQRNLQNSESETSADGTRKVPDPRGAPGDLGAPATREESDSIKRGSTSNRGNSGSTTATPDKDPADDLDDSLSSIDDDRFASPVEYRGSPGDRELKEPRRIAAKTAPDPCKKDPNGYSWLRGVVSRDSKSGSWRITYSRNELEDDPYGGTLTLADDPRLDTLKDGDVILVEGSIDRANVDPLKKPCYRVEQMTPPLKPKDQ